MIAPVEGDPPAFGSLPVTESISAGDMRDVTVKAPTLVILDDDPTGTQTVRDVPILTSWDDEDLRWAFAQETGGFFVLTNTRAYPPDTVASIVEQVSAACLRIADELGHRVTFAARGDSTLRGHFPLEVDVISAQVSSIGVSAPIIVLAPAYIDAGRVTLDGVHWIVGTDGHLLPVGESEYAKDLTFGYTSSRLSEWVVEKAGPDRFPILDIDLNTVRSKPETLRHAIASASPGAVVIADMVADDDVRAVARATAHLESEGAPVVYRCGPSMVRARLGQVKSPPLDAAFLATLLAPDSHGLIVVGSHVATTTRQLDDLLASRDLPVFEIDVDTLLGDDRERHIESVTEEAVRALASSSVVLRTSRVLHRGTDAASSLAVATEVNAAVVTAVSRIVDRRRPAYVLAKGGITSADVAARSLGIRRAWVRGTMLDGMVSLWETVGGPSEGLPYVVFAGNVGSDDDLRRVVDLWDSAMLARNGGAR